MPSKDFKIRVRNKDGKEFDARTSIVNFDSEDLGVAKAEWEKQHIGTDQTLVSIELIGDTTEQGMRAIQETVDKVNSVTARNAPPAPPSSFNPPPAQPPEPPRSPAPVPQPSSPPAAPVAAAAEPPAQP